MAAERGASQALVRKRQDTEMMPPAPPVKKIRRPKQVLDEDSYTEALSQIIARDFFPGLLESQIQQEYLDAMDSKDAAWISSASRRLRQVMTPGRRARATSVRRPMNGDQTPMTFVGDTPGTIVSQAEPEPPKLEANMSLSRFQETYTSEDNESFYKLLDKQNQKRADKYAWLWRGNKLPSKQMIAQKQVTDRLEEAGKLIDDGYMKKDRLAIKDSDDRPARPESWKFAPKNGLMYVPNDLDEGLTTVAQASENSSRMGPKAVVYANTRVPQPHVPKRPASPTFSSVRDAIAGRPRPQDRDSSVAGGETPRVNGYAFVDDEDDDSEPIQEEPVIDLGPGDANNPFKLQEQRKRESLHERMVERISKSKKESSKHGFTGRVEHTPVPKFPSSPRVSGNLTPAAQRLWSSMGTPKGKTPGGSFGESTPMRARGSLLKSSSKPGPKQASGSK